MANFDVQDDCLSFKPSTSEAAAPDEFNNHT